MSKNKDRLYQPTYYWHLELSSKCALKCPRCPRTEQKGKYKVTELSFDFIKTLFDDELLDNTEKILLCGGQGDSIYCKDFLSIINYLKTKKPDIKLSIVTNGSYKSTNFWTEVAKILNDKDAIVFSVDGFDNESNNQYRVNSDFDSIVNGVKTISEVNPTLNIIWSTIIFSFNENHLDKIEKVATESGATDLQIVKSNLFGSNIDTYIDPNLKYDPLEPISKNTKMQEFWYSDRDLIVPLKNRDKRIKGNLQKNYTETKNLTHKNKFTEIVQNLYYENKETFKQTDIIPSCLINERGLYVDAEGILYPCSWISHPFGSRKNKNKKITWDESLFVKYKKYFDLNKFSYKEILSGPYYKKLHESFKSKDKLFVECSKKCNSQSTINRINKYFKPVNLQENVEIFEQLKK